MRLFKTALFDTHIAKKLTKHETGKDCRPALDEKDPRIIHFYLDGEDALPGNNKTAEPELLSSYNRENGDMVVY